ncbi:hypothetical protein LLG95_08590 [bacterium]|nr:hypothetical protein [bacterium]
MEPEERDSRKNAGFAECLSYFWNNLKTRMNASRSLADTDQPLWQYVQNAFIFSFYPSIVIFLMAARLFPYTAASGSRNISVIVILTKMLIMFPCLGTLTLWGILALYKLILRRQWLAASGSALTWAIFLGMKWPALGLSVFIPFLVFSVAFLEWEKKSKLKAVFVVATIMFCYNFFPAILTAVVASGKE